MRLHNRSIKVFASVNLHSRLNTNPRTLILPRVNLNVKDANYVNPVSYLKTPKSSKLSKPSDTMTLFTRYLLKEVALFPTSTLLSSNNNKFYSYDFLVTLLSWPSTLNSYAMTESLPTQNSD